MLLNETLSIIRMYSVCLTKPHESVFISRSAAEEDLSHTRDDAVATSGDASPGAPAGDRSMYQSCCVCMSSRSAYLVCEGLGLGVKTIRVPFSETKMWSERRFWC